MFLQEIENAEIIKTSWFRDYFLWKGSITLKEPETLNKFISGIMDPFKDKEEDDIIRKEEEARQEYLKEKKLEQDKIRKVKKEREDKRDAEREQSIKDRKDKNIVCWPFCYAVPDPQKLEIKEWKEWKATQTNKPAKKTSETQTQTAAEEQV